MNFTNKIRAPRRGLTGSLVLFIAAMLFVACTEDASDESDFQEEQPHSKPWTIDILMGNFAVNTKNTVTNEDGVSVDHLSDYVNASALPDATLEVFSMNAYIPTTEAHTTQITGARVEVTNMNGEGSGNIFSDQQSEHVDTRTLEGQLYSIYRISGFMPGGISGADFANVVFSLQIAYSKGDVEVGTRTVKLEVYKR